MILGAWLFAIGACDLLRAARDVTSPRRRWVVSALGVVLLAGAGVVIGFDAAWWASIGVLWMASLVGWVVTSSLALHPDSSHHAAWRVAAFVSIGVPLLVQVFLWDTGPSLPEVPDRWQDTLLGQVGPARLVLFAAVGLFELSTSNILVRLLLDAIGVPAASHEGDLKGGRLLGPMERVFILVLAVAGELTAAAVVAAAKGLLRFPELQRSRTEEGPTAVSEYFLIGSFASWLLAVLGWLIIGL